MNSPFAQVCGIMYNYELTNIRFDPYGIVKPISYAVSAEYRISIVAKMTPNVGINSKREAGEYVRYPFLVILLGCVTVRLRVLW